MPNDAVDNLEQFTRGTVEVYSAEELAERLGESCKSGRGMRIKLGLDPTSPDIHLGHTVVLRKMRQFQDAGHKAVLIIGDYTARIGDPSGQDTTRPILTVEQIEDNAKTYFKQAGKILDTSEEKLEVRYNSEWLAKLTAMEIIQLTGKKTVAQMLQRDSFKKRMQAGVDVYMHEFLYPLMQGYDSVMIESDVELGGTDQTFNNLIGRDIQKAYGQRAQIVIIMPILVGLDGVEKMSKSKGNYIGVTDEPNEMFGKVMSISDEMMENYFTLLTDVPVEKIKELTDAAKSHPKESKVLLGKMIVSQFYDDEAGVAAAAHFEKVFSQKKLPDDIDEIEIAADPVMASKLLIACGLVGTGGEAKRAIKQGGVRIPKPVMDNLEQLKRIDKSLSPFFKQMHKQLQPMRDMQKKIKEQLQPMRDMQKKIKEQLQPMRDMQKNMQHVFDMEQKKAKEQIQPILDMQKTVQKQMESMREVARELNCYSDFESDFNDIEICIDGKKITDPNTMIVPVDGMVVQVGKRKFARLKVK